jgi:alkaline phosphatase
LVSLLLCFFATAAVADTQAAVADTQAIVQFGLITDVHANDMDSPVEGKVMVHFADRLATFAEAMNAWPAEFVVELGDFVNGNFVMGALGDPARIPGILQQAEVALSAFTGPVYHVLGNHDVYDLRKDEIQTVLGMARTYYSFDQGAYHFVVLDAQFETTGEPLADTFWRVLGTIPTEELDWLRSDLAATAYPTIVFVHQPIDSDLDTIAGGPPISNHLEVQAVLASSGAVIAVFQGHDHEFRHQVLEGVHYVTFNAFVDETEPTPLTYARVRLDPTERTIEIDGEGLQDDLAIHY